MGGPPQTSGELRPWPPTRAPSRLAGPTAAIRVFAQTPSAALTVLAPVHAHMVTLGRPYMPFLVFYGTGRLEAINRMPPQAVRSTVHAPWPPLQSELRDCGKK